MDDSGAPTGSGWPRASRSGESTPSRPARRGALSHLGDAIGEGLMAAVACGLALLAIAGLRWGWSRHPVSTLLLLGVLAATLGYGILALSRARAGRPVKGRVAAVAAVLVVGVGVWLVYVLTYCSCLGT